MLPGKKYTPEDILQILRRRFWMLIVPAAIVAAATAVVARRLPDVYRSETLILVVPQRVPETYVKATVTTKIEDRLQSITQQILSRTRLERIIQDFNLYADQRRTAIMEDVVERMRRDIGVQVVKGDAFRVSYQGDNPRTVMKVTDRLASLFIEENLRDREVLAEGTNQFLEAQLEDARRRLVEHEKKLEEYRKQHSGELPSQQNSNLQAVTNTEMQIQAVVESLNRDRDRRLVIEQQIGDLQRLEAANQDTVVPVANPDATLASGTPQQQLDAAHATLTALEQRLKPDHPDVQRMRRVVRDLEAKIAANPATATAPARAPRQSPVALQRAERISDMRAEMALLDRHITEKQEEEARLRRVSSTYHARMEMAPTRESELAELTRDYETLQGLYSKMLEKKEDSKIAANLERRQIGEQFKLLDPARLPEKPFSPNRSQLNLLGILLGIGVSAAVVVLLEYRDSTFRTDEEIVRVLALPVIAVVPLMQSTGERKRAFRRGVMLNVGLATTVVACLAVLAYTFVR